MSASHPIDVSYLLSTLGRVIMAHLRAGREDSLLALKYLNTSCSCRWMEAYVFSFVQPFSYFILLEIKNLQLMITLAQLNLKY